MSKTKTKLSTIEIAAKQRHLYLLGKVKGNKTLSKAELAELKRYERQIPARREQITAKTGVASKVQSKKKKVSMETSVKKRDRLPMRKAEVRRLGLECENLAEADSAIRTRSPLTLILKRYPQLRQAWDRGRFLRRLRGMASQAPSIAQAAGRLGLSEQAFQEMLDSDLEVGDIWKEEQLKLYVETRRQVFDLAADNVPWAIKIIYNLMTEHADAGMKTEVNVNTNQLARLTGKSSRTVYNWHTKFGLPRNADKTFNLRIFLLWYEEFLIKKAGGNVSTTPLDPLKAIKAERIKVELAKHRKELVNRDEVIVGQIAWFHHIIGCFERGIEELTRLCYGQPREKIKEIFKNFFLRLHIESCKVPKEFRLSMKQERELFEFLQSLKSHDDSDKIT